MIFGPVPVEQAVGTVLAHSLKLPESRIRKGIRLTEQDVQSLGKARVSEVVVARPEPGDLGEDQAAEILGQRFLAEGLSPRAPFTGRVNVVAGKSGVLEVDKFAINAANAVDEAVTIATLPDHTFVVARQLVATIKIITYFVNEAVLNRVDGIIGSGPLKLHGLSRKTASLVLSRQPDTKTRIVEKGRDSVTGRLTALGIELGSVRVVNHQPRAIAQALTSVGGDMILVLGASATSDRMDAVPAAVTQAGGHIERFGMPVDPGNLLFLGEFDNTPVIGLPGCIRSPVLNGADWVLQRVACGMKVDDDMIAEMGVGGLLKENPSRPQPRNATLSGTRAPNVAGILLAAGSARRMGGRDKLLMEVDNVSLLERSAIAMTRSNLDHTIVVIPAGHDERRSAVERHSVSLVEIPVEAAATGMATSLRAGLAAVPEGTEAVVIALADMPDVSEEHINRLIEGFSPQDDREICRAIAENGAPGHPVLFGERFFENLALLEGDRGARELLGRASRFLVDVPTPGLGAVIDLDTEEDWSAWRSGQWRTTGSRHKHPRPVHAP